MILSLIDLLSFLARVRDPIWIETQPWVYEASLVLVLGPFGVMAKTRFNIEMYSRRPLSRACAL